MEEKAKDFYSKSVADAIRQACSEFATSQEKLDIEVVETGSAGIFGLCRKRAHIRVTRKEKTVSVKKSKGKTSPGKEVVHAEGRKEKLSTPEEKKATVQKPSGKVEKSEKETAKGKGKIQQREPEAVEPPSDEALAAVKSNLEEVLRLMGFPSAVSLSVENASILCQIDGEHEENIVGPGGRTLDSLQYILRKMASSQLPDRVMIDLNAGDFRERRVEELKQKAAELAEKVKADGKTQAIPALNPSERRVVHVTLQDDKSIRSRSVGDGLFKKVLIYKPGNKARKSGGRRRGRQGGRSADK